MQAYILAGQHGIDVPTAADPPGDRAVVPSCLLDCGRCARDHQHRSSDAIVAIIRDPKHLLPFLAFELLKGAMCAIRGAIGLQTPCITCLNQSAKRLPSRMNKSCCKTRAVTIIQRLFQACQDASLSEVREILEGSRHTTHTARE